MQVFKVFFRIIWACRTPIMIYVLIFLGITVFASRFYVSPAVSEFTEAKTKIAVINRDGESPLVSGLTEYLSLKNTIVELPDNSEKMQDALFFRNVEYIAIIPKGFSADFEKGGNAQINTVVVPDSFSARYIDVQIDKYLGAMRLAQKYSGLSPDRQAELVNDSLDTGADVRLTGRVKTSSDMSFIFYYNYLAYVLLATSTLGISTIMMVFNRRDLKMRNLCSPIEQHSVSAQLALGSAVYSLGCWLLMLLFSIIIYGGSLLPSGLLPALSVNALTFTIVSTAIGFLVGILIKSQNVQAAIANVLTLGMSFLCGVFVPQELLGKTVVSFSRILPAYWFIRANNAISQSSGFADIAFPIVVQLGFAAVMFAAALFINKKKRTSA